ncbi:hypothetical protein X474_13720 [Dethiosulfatarculus sandiegensis]|uniref:Uncharacterized protein n=1 Tax=Dethiosulfatarculus sandiegensis TaxID=1429043 RepID=A0A0D2J616_9BACT|nr:hypothetical protein X474_13720 [Dethiosulfatarculus sandiegensis]
MHKARTTIGETKTVPGFYTITPQVVNHFNLKTSSGLFSDHDLTGL